MFQTTNQCNIYIYIPTYTSKWNNAPNSSLVYKSEKLWSTDGHLSRFRNGLPRGTNRGHLLKGNHLPNQAPKDGSPTLLPSYTPIFGNEISPICRNTKWLLWIYWASELQAQLFQDRFVAWPPEGILLEGASISKSAPATNDHQTYPPSKKTDANDANLRFPHFI